MSKNTQSATGVKLTKKDIGQNVVLENGELVKIITRLVEGNGQQSHTTFAAMTESGILVEFDENGIADRVGFDIVDKD